MGLNDQPSENTYGFRKCCEAVKAAVPIEVIARRYTELKPLGTRGGRPAEGLEGAAVRGGEHHVTGCGLVCCCHRGQ